MRDESIDDALARAAGASPGVDPALLDRIAGSIGGGLKPVRPLPPSWVLIALLAAVCAGIATAGATILGLHGIGKMGSAEIGVVFPALGLLIWFGASVSTAEMIPGSPHRAAPWLLTLAGSLVLVLIFGLLFHDYRTDDFVHQGMKCLITGLLHAAPTALAGWFVLHRGVAVNPIAAGFALGTLAGFAGVTMLELHCPNFEAPHVMLWHTAVLPLAGVAGALCGWAGRRKSAHYNQS